MRLDASTPGLPECARHVLMVACAFPPIGGSGVQRSVKFAKYLPRFGWRPTVWAADRMDGLPEDPTLLSDLPPEVTIHRHRHDGPMRRLQRTARAGTHRRRWASVLGRAVEWRMEAWLRRRSVPDESVGWARASLRPLRRLIRTHEVDVIYSTLSPASNHLLGLELARRTHRPWVADFRDLWTDEHRYEDGSPKARAAHRQLEQQVLETADVVIGVNNRQTAMLASRVPGGWHKFVTITNGFDPDDFPPDGPDIDRDRGRFVLSFVGRFDRWRTDEVWWAGVRRFMARPQTDPERFAFRMVGHANHETAQQAQTCGVNVSITGYLSHAEAVREMRSADALLLATPTGPNGDTVLPGKLFEYLAARRPILVIGPAGTECQRIVRLCEAGLIGGTDPAAIGDALGTMYDRWQCGRPMAGCKVCYLPLFSRVELTRRLATVLDRLCEKRRLTRRTDTEGVMPCAQ